MVGDYRRAQRNGRAVADAIGERKRPSVTNPALIVPSEKQHAQRNVKHAQNPLTSEPVGSVAEHQPAGERAKAEDRDQPCCVPAVPRPREQREGSYERSGRGARETTGTRLGRAAETSGRGRACEESWKTVEIKMSAANPGAPDPIRGQVAETGHPEPDRMRATRQPSSSISHLASSGIKSVPSPVPDKAMPDAIPRLIEPGLHRRNRGRVADRQLETKTRAEGDGTGCWVGSCR